MIKNLLFLLSLLFVVRNGYGQEEKYAEDVKSEDAIIAALYDVISGPKGEKRNWERMEYLFVPNAKLIPTRVESKTKRMPHFMSLEQYKEQADEWFIENGFFENEVSRRSESFSSLTHVWSTYESRWTPEDESFARGINSIQLLNDGQRWWVVTIHWVGETEDTQLPKKYLRKEP